MFGFWPSFTYNFYEVFNMDKKNDSRINADTRDIYHKQHTRMLNDSVTLKRIMNIQVDEEFFKLEKGYFKNRKVLDAGCGSIVRNSIAYAQLGSVDVTALDIGNEWHAEAK